MRSLKNNILEGILDTDDITNDDLADVYYKDLIIDPKSRNREIKSVEVSGDTLKFKLVGHTDIMGSMFSKLKFKTYIIDTEPRAYCRDVIYIKFDENDKNIPAGTTIIFPGDSLFQISVPMRCAVLKNVNFECNGDLFMGSGFTSFEGIRSCKFNIRGELGFNFSTKDNMFDDKCVIECDNLAIYASSEKWDKYWHLRSKVKAQDAINAAWDDREVKDLIGTNNVKANSLFIQANDPVHINRTENSALFHIRNGKLIYKGER